MPAVISVDTFADERDGSIIDGDVSLRDAVAVASSGDTIDFDAALDGGVILLTLGEVRITQAVTIDASALPAGLTVDASGNDPTSDRNNGDGSRVFNIDDGTENNFHDVTIRGLTLTGGDVNEEGGAILARENLHLVSSTVSDSSAGSDGSGSGGGIHASGNLTLSESTITGNDATYGGGIATYGITEITSTTISSNSSRNWGGGIYGFGAIAIASSTISGNSARTIGGGISARGPSLTIDSSTVADNVSDRHIGGIDFSGTLVVNSSQITGNVAQDGYGGGVGAYDATVTSSTISGNSASFGGGIFAERIVTIRSSTISDNSANIGSGGGIWTRDSVTVTDSTISDNTANISGGGIDAYGVQITSSTISRNSANVDTGGGISAHGNTTITSSAVSDNSAAHGGGVFIRGELMLESSTISGNSARNYGGIYARDDLHVVVSTVSGNSADSGSGGGIFAWGELTLTSSTISGNSAQVTGGGVYAHRASTVKFSTIAGNTAADKGGGIGTNTGVITIENSIVAANSGNALSPEIHPGNGVLSLRYSLIGDNSGIGRPEASIGFPDVDGNLIGDPAGAGIIDPRLKPLALNGGSTPTHALLDGSPAIDMSDPNATAGVDDVPLHDQRGPPFVRISDRRMDMGAYEAQGALADVDANGRVDCDDVDILVAAIVEGSNRPDLDLTGDTIVDQSDLDMWLSSAGAANLASGQPYLRGDANLDGKVDAADLNIIGLNWLQPVVGWCAGNFSPDARIDANDLNALALNWLADLSGEGINAAEPTRRRVSEVLPSAEMRVEERDAGSFYSEHTNTGRLSSRVGIPARGASGPHSFPSPTHASRQSTSLETIDIESPESLSSSRPIIKRSARHTAFGRGMFLHADKYQLAAETCEGQRGSLREKW